MQAECLIIPLMETCKQIVPFVIVSQRNQGHIVLTLITESLLLSALQKAVWLPVEIYGSLRNN